MTGPRQRQFRCAGTVVETAPFPKDKPCYLTVPDGRPCKTLCETYRIDPLWLLSGPGDEPQYVGSRQIDTDLLEEIIRLVEEWLAKHRRMLRADKKHG
jgi:hypothetical protein